MKDKFNGAFTLLELTIVIAIISLVAFPIVGFIASLDKVEKYELTRSKIKEIQTALHLYYKSDSANAVLPCPADIVLTISDSSVGVATCDDQALDASNQVIYYGGIPIEDLGLNAEYLVDAWGNKLSYYVAKDVVDTAASNGYINIDNYNLLDSTGTPASASDLAYVIISHGEDGIGSYNLSGIQYGLSSDASINEQLNIYSSSKVIDSSNPLVITKGDIGDIAYAAKKNDLLSAFVLDNANNGLYAYQDIVTIDTVKGFVGVVNNSPAYELDIIGDANFSSDLNSNTLIVNSLMGVADTTPSYELDIDGDMRVTADFFADTAIGIANNSPSYELDVTGDGYISGTVSATAFVGDGSAITGISSSSLPWTSSGSDIYYSTGNIGINDSSPSYELDVTGDGNISGTIYAGYFSGDGSALTNLTSTEAWSSNGSDIYYSSGNVGIGTTDPQYDLDIYDGEVDASGIYGANTSYYAGLGGSSGNNSFLYQISFEKMYDTHDTSYYVDIAGTSNFLYFEKISGSFDIPHPDPAKISEDKNYRLRHYFVETPSAGGNIYKFQIELKKGLNEFDLEDYHKYLNKDSLIWVNPFEHFGIAYGQVNELSNKIEIYADSKGIYNILLFADRKDELAMANFEKYGIEYIQDKDKY